MKNTDYIIEKIKPILKEKKAVIFDMDGTLIDSMPMWSSLDVKYMNSIGIEPRPDFHEKVRTLTISLAAEYIHEAYNTSQTPAEIEAEFKEMAYHYYSDTIPLKPGVFELVKQLAKAGYKLSVATANDISMTAACLKRLGIYEDFSAVVNCDMAGATKAKPDVFDLACERMKVSREDCVIFEDSLYAIKTAVEAGYSVIGVYEASQSDKWDEICGLTECQVVFE